MKTGTHRHRNTSSHDVHCHTSSSPRPSQLCTSTQRHAHKSIRHVPEAATAVLHHTQTRANTEPRHTVGVSIDRLVAQRAWPPRARLVAGVAVQTEPQPLAVRVVRNGLHTAGEGGGVSVDGSVGHPVSRPAVVCNPITRPCAQYTTVLASVCESGCGHYCVYIPTLRYWYPTPCRPVDTSKS